MVSNVQVVDSDARRRDAARGDGQDAAFCVYRNRVETETDFLVGKREDLLRRG